MPENEKGKTPEPAAPAKKTFDKESAKAAAKKVAGKKADPGESPGADEPKKKRGRPKGSTSSGSTGSRKKREYKYGATSAKQEKAIARYAALFQNVLAPVDRMAREYDERLGLKPEEMEGLVISSALVMEKHDNAISEHAEEMVLAAMVLGIGAQKYFVLREIQADRNLDDMPELVPPPRGKGSPIPDGADGAE